MVKKALSIGTASAQPGEKDYGFVPVTHRSDGSPIRIPVSIINGKKEGPTLCVDACVHGDEYEGPATIWRLIKTLDPEELCGTFIGVPVVNTTAYEAGTRTSPIDHLDLNRIFPGKPDGTVSEKVAYAMLNEVAAKTDYLIDLHSGGNIERMPPGGVVVAPINTIPLDLIKTYNPQIIWRSPPWAGATLRDNSIKRGVISFGGESGGEGRCRDLYVDNQHRGVSNVMKHLGMVDGEPEIVHREIPVIEATPLFSPRGGFFDVEAKVLDELKEGEVIGRILNMFGEPVDQVEAPHDGFVLMERTFPMIRPGEWACIYARLLETVTC